MPLKWVEDGESRAATIVRRGKRGSSTYVKSYKVFGTADDSMLHSEINNRISTSEYGWQYPGVTDTKLWVDSYSVSYLGDNAWQVTVNYVKEGIDSNDTSPLKRSRSFDTTGGTQHITQSRAPFLNSFNFPYWEKRYPDDAPNCKGAIGVDENGVNGVDIVVPQLQWTESYDVPSDYVTDNYIRKVAGLTGTVNLNKFRGFETGEVLFTGCTGSHEWDTQKGDGPWSLAFKFIASPNVNNQTIGDITGIAKNGHDYLWVRYESKTDGNALIKSPSAVYLNRVYEYKNFSDLGIGTE